MVHLLASIAFSLVALSAFGLTMFMLAQDQDKIMMALGVRREPVRTTRRPVRVRAAGRWQAVTATAARPWRAAA